MKWLFDLLHAAGIPQDFVNIASLVFGVVMGIYGLVMTALNWHNRRKLKQVRAEKISARIDDQKVNPMCLMFVMPNGMMTRRPGKSLPDIHVKLARELVVEMRKCIETDDSLGLRGVLRIPDGVKVGKTDLRPTVQKALYDLANEHTSIYDLFAATGTAGFHEVYSFATFEHPEDLNEGVTAQWRQEGMTFAQAKELVSRPDGFFMPVNPDHVKNIRLRRAVAMQIVAAVEGEGEAQRAAVQILKEISIKPSLPAVDPAGGRG